MLQVGIIFSYSILHDKDKLHHWNPWSWSTAAGVARNTSFVFGNTSSFTCHHPCNNQTALYVHHFGGYSRCTIKSYSHSFRFACDKSTVSLLESREQHYTEVIVIVFTINCTGVRKWLQTLQSHPALDEPQGFSCKALTDDLNSTLSFNGLLHFKPLQNTVFKNLSVSLWVYQLFHQFWVVRTNNTQHK